MLKICKLVWILERQKEKILQIIVAVISIKQTLVKNMGFADNIGLLGPEG